jgi:hypothetical protein
MPLRLDSQLRRRNPDFEGDDEFIQNALAIRPRIFISPTLAGLTMSQF